MLEEKRRSNRKCIWCLEKFPEVTFEKKAHSIPKSLGGQNYNRNVCDICNAYFGNRNCHNGKYSIEEALKETFILSRKRFLQEKTKRKVGNFKSKFFDVKEKKGKFKIKFKDFFSFYPWFSNGIVQSLQTRSIQNGF